MLTGSPKEICTYLGQERSLRANRIGLPGLLLSVLAATGPLMATAGVMPTVFGEMRIAAQPLVFVLVGAVLMLFSVGYAEMSRHVHNAGAFYAYIARGLGGTAGAGASMVALVSYSSMQVAVYGVFGYELSGQLDRFIGIRLEWWLPAFAAVAVTGVLGWLKIELNAKVLGVLLLVECLLVVVFDVAGLSEPGREGLSLHAFDAGTLGGAGLGTALCFCVAAFVGFEQAPVYAEETARPHVLVPRSMLLAVASVAVFYVVSAWALSVAAGPSHVVAESLRQGPDMLFTLARSRLGETFTDVLHVFYLSSMFAAMLSFHNVVARYAFAMGRDGLLPGALGRTVKGSGAPAYGSLLQTVVSAGVVAIFAAIDHRPPGDPTVPVLELLAWMANIGALGVILLMAAASSAVIVFFVRRGAARPQAWRLAASGVACAALVAIAVLTVKDFGVLLGTDPGSALSWLLPSVIAVTAVGGLVYGRVLKAVRPGVHDRIGLGNEAFQLDKAATAASVAAS